MIIAIKKKAHNLLVKIMVLNFDEQLDDYQSEYVL